MIRLGLTALLASLSLLAGTNSTESWNPKTAASYLDGRASWWMSWKPAAREKDTFCISCHTALPYALGRPALRATLGERGPSPIEQRLLANVVKRVRLWSELQPLYTDEHSGPDKSTQSRGTEAVLNALILTSAGLTADARIALDNMWSLQYPNGEKAGAFPWLNFHNEPWEADDSPYWGATLAALAVGAAPADYRSSAAVKQRVQLLAAYLRSNQSGQSLLNRLVLVWASSKLPELLSPQEQALVMDQVLAKQQADGGWSATTLLNANWKRKDGTPLETKSDGYATGLAAFVLELTKLPRSDARLKRALTWLLKNQDQASGAWPGYSLNKQRDPASDVGRFMSDAATSFAVMALSPEK